MKNCRVNKLRWLRLQSLLLILFTFHLVSAKAAADPKANFGFQNASLEAVIKKVETLFDVRFTYDATIVAEVNGINLPKKERTLEETLQQLSGLTGLRFMKAGKLVGIQKPAPVSSIQVPHFEKVVITGRVLDANNQPVSGATVSVKGGTKGVTTDAEGNFSIEVEKGDVLLISYVGYATQELIADQTKTLNLVLSPSDKALEEVVVTALGIKKEKNKISYATQEVKGAVLEKAPEPNVAQNLIGKIAGLDIRAKTNLFENPEIYLRGEETLIVIDGVPTEKGNFDFWNLNANDIENINVLKGTAAAALYGSLGINGAIMITTKKGKAGGNGVEVTYNSTTQFQAGYTMIPKTQKEYGMGFGGYYAFIDGKGGGGWNDDYGYVYGPKLDVLNSANASGFEEYPQYNSPYDPNTLFTFTQAGYTDQSHYKPIPWISRGKDNLKNFLDNGFMTSHNISVAGKGDNSEYRISLSHMYQKGQVPNTHLNATTINLAGSLRPTEKLKLEGTVSYNKQYTPNYPQTSYGANNFFYNLLLWMGPDVDVRDLREYWKPAGGRTSGGTFIPYGVENVQQFNYNYSWYNNPWYIAYEALNGYNNDVITAQLNANYDFTKNLSLYVRSGVITNFALSTLQTPKSYIYYGNTEFEGNYSEGRRNNFQIVTDAVLTYKTKFLTDFNLTASAGASTRYNKNSYLQSRTNGLNVPELYNLDNTVGPVVSTNRLAERKINSVFGYVDVDYKQMIFLGGTLRSDYTTTLQKPNNSYVYPSASLGIIPTNMIQFPEFISFVKLRASWAAVTTDKIEINDNPDEGIFRDWYATLPVFAPGPRWNGNNASLNLPGLLIKEGLKPNKTVSQEYGAEIRFLKNRLGLDFTYFSYIDKDFAIEAPVSSASGFNNQLVNGDRINRKGVEIVLSGSPVRKTTFRWDVTANFSTVHSYVEEYYGGVEIRDAIKVGERIDVMRNWDWQRSPDGQIVYGSNGFPAYVDHIVNIGHTDPDFIFGLHNSFNYKNFGLSFSFDGRIGGIMYNGVEQKLYEGGMHPATSNSYRDDAYAGNKTFVGPGVVITSGSADYDVQGNVINDSRKFAPNTQAVNYVDWIFATYVNGVPGANIFTNSFVKLREVVLTYNTTPKMLRKTPFKGASISVTGRNLALFTDVPFVDPDGSNGGLAEPAYRNIGFNINLKF